MVINGDVASQTGQADDPSKGQLSLSHPPYPPPTPLSAPIGNIIGCFDTVVVSLMSDCYPARRACALRALGLLLADGAPTAWGKTFWVVGRVPLTKTGITWKRKVAQ